MGQKTNPEIIRLGKTKEWETKYLEKKSTELPLYSFFNIEIKNFIHKFFEKYNLNVKTCQISLSETSIHIFVSFFSNANVHSVITKINEKQKIKLKFKKIFTNNQKKKLILVKNCQNYNVYTKKKFFQNLMNKSDEILKKKFNFKQGYKRLGTLKVKKAQNSFIKYNNQNTLKGNTLVKKLIKSLDNFTNKKLNFFLTLEQINNNFNLTEFIDNNAKKKLNASLVKLRKFQRNDFFRNGITLAYVCVQNPNSSKLITDYLKFHLTKISKPNFFLRFFKNVLNVFIKKKTSKLKQIQIIIKGRLNGVPRAKNKIIKIGKGIPVLTLNSNISFSEDTAFTANGTLGIKVWTYQKF